MNNYPKDDELSLMQGVPCEANLDYWPGIPYHIESFEFEGLGTLTHLFLHNDKIEKGTVVGTIELMEDGEWKATQNFVISVNNVFTFEFVDFPPVKLLESGRYAVKGNADLDNQMLNIEFHDCPGEHRITVKYEAWGSETAYYSPAYEAAVNSVRNDINDPNWNPTSYEDLCEMEQTNNTTEYTDYLVSELAKTRKKLEETEKTLISAHDDYDKRIEQTKDKIVGQLDTFLKLKSQEYLQNKTAKEVYEEATK